MVLINRRMSLGRYLYFLPIWNCYFVKDAEGLDSIAFSNLERDFLEYTQSQKVQDYLTEARI